MSTHASILAMSIQQIFLTLSHLKVSVLTNLGMTDVYNTIFFLIRVMVAFQIFSEILIILHTQICSPVMAN